QRQQSALQSQPQAPKLLSRRRTRLQTLSPLQPNPHSAALLLLPNLPRVPWRLSDDGPSACRGAHKGGRRPKPITNTELGLLSRPDLRGAYRLRHTEKDHDALAAAASR